MIRQTEKKHFKTNLRESEHSFFKVKNQLFAFYLIKLDLVSFESQKYLETRNQKKIMFTLLFITGEMKYNFVSRVVGVNRPMNQSEI